MKKHPITTFIFIYACDILAIIISSIALFNMKTYSLSMWITVICWTIFLCIARIGGKFEFIGIKVETGWATAIEVASILVLPFPLYCLAMLTSFICIIIKRLYNKHPEPFVGPDFNASNNIISAFIAIICYEKIVDILDTSMFITIIPLLASTLLYASIGVMLLTTLIALDERKPWLRVGTLTADSLITEGVLVITGALIGRVYSLDPFLILLMLIPLLMLHSALSKINEAKLIYIDEKTGLYNYRYFDEKVSELFEKCKLNSQPLSMVFGDMDYLRNVNNTYGHQVGDQALIAIANVLKNSSSDKIFAARFGGEEFVLLMQGFDKDQAFLEAENIRIKIENTILQLESGDTLKVTMSLGVATYPFDVENIEQLIKASDSAVYEAKRLGRNRVVLYRPEFLKKDKE